MRTYVYSAKYNAFHPVELKQRYIDAGTWPTDGIEVSEAVYDEFLTPPPGKYRVAGADGLPTWDDIPPPTPEQLQSVAESQKRQLLSEARERIDICQDAVDLGIATDIEISTLRGWRKYRVLLNRVDCSNAPDIHWPEQPE
ncbi:tail fiber assembly protein [Xenorhabdus szentirmaii]|uniref:tail fiber assembly protein n=1 Tax=Xenorhabdus szentirmaii TaxID=290112 RepID=UPI000C03A485|nr:tail fiber assembly protein [Xenorhabdus szentirmaii]PHM43763.1 phage tail fiber assembly [Xenorhabdus szentirmaii]